MGVALAYFSLPWVNFGVLLCKWGSPMGLAPPGCLNSQGAALRHKPRAPSPDRELGTAGQGLSGQTQTLPAVNPPIQVTPQLHNHQRRCNPTQVLFNRASHAAKGRCSPPCPAAVRGVWHKNLFQSLPAVEVTSTGTPFPIPQPVPPF